MCLLQLCCFLLIIHHYWQILTPRIYSLVCFRLLPRNGDEGCASKLNHALLDAVNSTGMIFISHTVSSLSSTSRDTLTMCFLVLFSTVFMTWLLRFYYTGAIGQVHITICSRSSIDWGEACECSMEGFARWGLCTALNLFRMTILPIIFLSVHILWPFDICLNDYLSSNILWLFSTKIT